MDGGRKGGREGSFKISVGENDLYSINKPEQLHKFKGRKRWMIQPQNSHQQKYSNPNTANTHNK
jgi:hypothetical protein